MNACEKRNPHSYLASANLHYLLSLWHVQLGSCTDQLELIGALRVAAMEREETSEQQKARRAVEAVQAAAQEAKVLPGSLHNAPEPSPSLQIHSPRIQ